MTDKTPPTNRPPQKGPRSSRNAGRCAKCGATFRGASTSCPGCGAPNPENIVLVPATPAPTFKERWLPIILIAALAFAAYLPSLDNGFVSWDDDHYIYKNHQVHYDDGIRSIWFDVFKHSDKKFQGDGRTEDRVSHQYYPMVFTIYWIEFQLHKWFGDADPLLTIEENIEYGNMSGFVFHLNSVLMHMINVMLLIFCFRQLGVSNWVAWVATILFALHPMHASSVAWAAERKNIISLMFYLLSLMSYIKLRRDGKWWRYALAVVLYQAALFSKTVALTLPVVLFFTDRLLERRWDARVVWASILRIIPFVILSCIAAWTTINVEDRQRTIPISPSQRPLLPAAILLWYPYKLLLPLGQSPVYSLWPVNATNFAWFLPTLAVVGLAALALIYRRKLGPLFIWALLFYCITQGPMLGIKNINYFQFAYVADHYFYHGAVGLALMLALALDALRRRIRPPEFGQRIASVFVIVLALACAVRTYTYVNVWTDSESFWSHILARHPSCWPGWYNMANARRRTAVDIGERLRKPVLTTEERAKLRERAAALRAEAGDRSLPDVQRRAKALAAYQADQQAGWPDLSDEEVRALRQEQQALFDDAVERYKKVKDIHKQITQPFDQWITVRDRLQNDPAGAYEAAAEAGRRFPQLLQYHELAGKYAAKAEMHKECYESRYFLARTHEEKKNLSEAARYHLLAGEAAAKAGMTAEAVESLTRGGTLSSTLAEREKARRNACAAADLYEQAARALSAAAHLDPERTELKASALDAARLALAERELCPKQDADGPN